MAFSSRLSATALDEDYVSTLFSDKKRVFFGWFFLFDVAQ